MNPKFLIVNYRYGLFKNITLQDFIEQSLLHYDEYELFQVVDHYEFSLGGGHQVTYLILKKK